VVSDAHVALSSFEKPVVSLLVVVSLFVALEDPAPAGPPVALPAVEAEASPDPGLCALSRAPLGLDVSPLTALE
jgi:hypothetical protein